MQWKRLKDETLSIKINKKNIAEICALTIDKAIEFLVILEIK